MVHRQYVPLHPVGHAGLAYMPRYIYHLKRGSTTTSVAATQVVVLEWQTGEVGWLCEAATLQEA